MSTETLSCPHCHASNLKLVGCFVYSPEGVEYSEAFSFLDLKAGGVFETQKLLQCQECNKHVPLNTAQAEGSAEKPLRWETSVRGKSIPIICPICKNKTDFYQDRLCISEQIYSGSMQEDKTFDLQDLFSEEVRDAVVLRYRCTLDGCAGIVSVNDDTFTMTPL